MDFPGWGSMFPLAQNDAGEVTLQETTKSTARRYFGVSLEARVVLLGWLHALHMFWPPAGDATGVLICSPPLRSKGAFSGTLITPHISWRCVVYEIPRGDSALNSKPWS